MPLFIWSELMLFFCWILLECEKNKKCLVMGNMVEFSNGTDFFFRTDGISSSRSGNPKVKVIF